MFRRLFTLGALTFALTPVTALTTGDIAFTAFNADEDGWSIATFVDLAANTQIYFSDSTATNATTMGTNESSFLWTTGSSVISAGTIVRFSAIDVASRASSVGTFTAIGTANLGLSATAETVYAYQGSSVAAPTTFLTAVSSEANTDSLTIVGLTAGTNAIKLTSSADYAGYTGARTGQSTFTGYGALINNPANWSINVGGDGATVVPDMTVLEVPEPESYAMVLAGLSMLAFMRRRRS